MDPKSMSLEDLIKREKAKNKKTGGAQRGGGFRGGFRGGQRGGNQVPRLNRAAGGFKRREGNFVPRGAGAFQGQRITRVSNLVKNEGVCVKYR